MSKLRVNDVLPANGLNIGIGTAGGNLIVGGASTTVVVNGDINITGNIDVGANNGFHVDGGAPASSLTVNNLGNTVVGSGHSVYIADGNLVFQTTGTGIDFSSVGIASTSASSSTLDDYEEGSWTPQYTTSNDDWSSTVNDQSGLYVKIGRMVHLSFRIQENRSAGTGALQITNLPFAPSSADRFVLTINPVFGNWTNTNAPRGGFIISGSRILLKKADGSDARITLDTNVDASTVVQPGLIANIVYYV